jgi:hypothetical protein
MTTAEHREPCHSNGSRTVLGAPGGEIPPGGSTIGEARLGSVCFRYVGMNRHRANFGHRCGDLGRWKQLSYKNINCENGAAMSAISKVRHCHPSFAVIWQCTAHWSRKVRPLPLTGLEKLYADDVTSWPPSSNNRRRLSLSRRRDRESTCSAIWLIVYTAEALRDRAPSRRQNPTKSIPNGDPVRDRLGTSAEMPIKSMRFCGLDSRPDR